MRWVVTGGAGFIGSHFVRTALSRGWADEVVVLDKLTYAGNLANLDPVAQHPGLRFVRGDICVARDVEEVLADGADGLFHFAAESHVDRSIVSASAFVQTNVVGTQILLDVARARGVGRFVHVSTDEVYGALSLEEPTRFTEQTPLAPTSPYAASKASSDLMVLAAHRTHGLDAVVTRCSNNYGPYQYPEKFIPLFIIGCLEGKQLPLYGDGRNVRDWIHVEDHSAGIRLAFSQGEAGQIYNLGGNCERANRDIAHLILDLTQTSAAAIVPVADRLAHDRRYAVDASRAIEVLGFCPGAAIETRLESLVRWYQDNRPWWQAIQSGQYQAYYQQSVAPQLSSRAD